MFNVKREMYTWQMQDAQTKLAVLISNAKKQGPQIISIKGKPAAAVVSMEDFVSIADRESNIVQFLQNSPLKGLDIEFKRDKSGNRKIEL